MPSCPNSGPAPQILPFSREGTPVEWSSTGSGCGSLPHLINTDGSRRQGSGRRPAFLFAEKRKNEAEHGNDPGNRGDRPREEVLPAGGRKLGDREVLRPAAHPGARG